MKTLERSSVRALSEDIMEALKTVADKHGIHFASKGARFTPSNCTFKIEASVIGDNGVVESQERKDFVQYAFMYKLKPEWLDKTFVHGTDTFTITGLSTRKSKNPVLCRNERNQKTYIFPANTVAVMMYAQTQIPTVV
jgi:hypothetical protein